MGLKFAGANRLQDWSGSAFDSSRALMTGWMTPMVVAMLSRMVVAGVNTAHSMSPKRLLTLELDTLNSRLAQPKLVS